MKYRLLVPFSRYEGGRLVRYRPGAVIHLSDDERRAFHRSEVEPVAATERVARGEGESGTETSAVFRVTERG